MLSKKQLFIFVIGLFAAISTILFVFVLRKADFYESVQKAKASQINDVRFYKDYMRDGGDIDLPIAEQSNKEDFMTALKTIEPSSVIIKSLGNKTWYKLRLKIVFDKEYFYTIKIFTGDEPDKLGIVSITEGQTIETNVGTFQSEALLHWAENMANKQGFEEIRGNY